MSGYHDQLASIVGDFAVKKIRDNNLEWKQIFRPTIHRVGDWNWPRPDYVCFDTTVTYALEFKPPRQSKREYLTGLGQCIAYLKKHNYSGLILPRLADDSFEISKFILETMGLEAMAGLPITLIDYDENTLFTDPDRSIRIIRPINAERTEILVPSTGNETYWCWWRDMSNFEVYDLLKLAYRYRDEPGDIYTTSIWPAFSKQLKKNATKTWEGIYRNKTLTEATLKAEKQNYKIPLFQLGLISQGSGRITNTGIRLMFFGDLYGPDSQTFRDYLAQLLLVEGRYLELLKDLDRFQKENFDHIGDTAPDLYLHFEDYLEAKGSIGPRKPSAKTTGAKATYIRDETKICNKLGLIESKGNRYFIPNEGIHINWERITDLVLQEFSI